MAMAAEAAVSFAVEKLGEALINKVAFLRGVEEQVNLLKDELERIYGFLRYATQKQGPDNEIGVWISQIRQVAHDIEDVIEIFSLKIDTPRRSRGMLEKCACFPYHLKHLNKLGKEIESIRARLKNIFESRTTFGIQDLREAPEFRRPQNIALQRRRLVPQQKDKDVVGLEKYVNDLLREAILNDRPGLLISRITGIGGLGKSTLAREVYNHADVLAARYDFRGWVVVSEEFDAEGVIKKLLLQLGTKEEEMKMLCVEELKGKLWEKLSGKQYFIVVDDVWEQQHWEFLADAFPGEEEQRSRLLVTSRNRNVPNTARFASELQPLNPDTSWQLFLKKSFIDDTNGECPPQLEDIGREIVRKCGGLPLAITVVVGLLLSEGKSPQGGLLPNERHTRQGWERILNGLDSSLSRSENRVSAVLELSYHNLPPRLKACFLCFGFFKEDATIKAEKLVQVWIAQGLISQEGSEEIVVEIANGYLDELINQNLVQVKKMTKDGDRVKTCQIHDLIRELSINKAKEEIGFEILKEGIHSQSSEKSRHHAIYCSTEKITSLVSPNNNHIRSLFFHINGNYTDLVPSFNWKKFILLRILDFEGCMLGNLPAAIGTLVGLRYLGLRDNYLEELPISLGCLVHLQVLDIRKNIYVEVPDILWKLESLRHLYMDDLNLDAPLRLDTLKNLQTLVCSHADRWMRPKHIMEMTNLRKLEVWVREEEVSEFISSLAKLKNLVCLKLNWESFGIPISNLEVLSTLHNLTELELWDKMALPFRNIFPPNLSQLTLCGTQIDQDPMGVLEKLPNLLYLNLKDGAYVGREMVISDDGFPRLIVLCIEELKELRKIELVGEGSGMPQLKRFGICWCPEIESLPKRITSLQELEIKACPKIESLLEQMNHSDD